jgi:hypothetical protein
MRLVTRPRVAALLVSGAILGGFALSLLRGDNVSPSIPSREDWLFHAESETSPYPRTVSSYVDLRHGRPPAPPGVIAVVVVDAVVAIEPAEPRGPLTGPTPPPMGRPASADYGLRVIEPLAGAATGDVLTLTMYGAAAGQNTSLATFAPFPHPEVGQHLLVALQRSWRPGGSGKYLAAGGSIIDISGPKARFLDAWHTSVKEMGAPESTPAFIEAVRAALAGRP